MNEAARVRELADMLEGGGAGAIGALMNESYVSCRDDYEISRPELDGLHQALLAGGAAGARIAGAGFGGCMLAVAEAGAEEELARRLEREYFRRCGAISGGECKDNSPPREDELFYVGAAQGASVQEI